MIINLKKKTILRASKPESQVSYLKFNKSERDSTTAFINHKESCKEQACKTNKQSKKTIPLLLTKHIYPHNEVNKLAEQWCQLLVNQIQEEHTYAGHCT